jgi:hypothetical protein
MASGNVAVITVRRLHRIADKVGERRKQEETVLGRKLGRLVPNLGHTRRSGEVRQARQAFEDFG